MDEVKLPEGWEYSQLLNLGTIVTGKTPNTKDVDNFGGNIPFIKPGDLDKGGFITETSDTLTESGLLTVPKLPVNAIVVTCIGNLGKVGITTKTSATNQQINSFICNENLNFKFLYYQICTLKPWLENESSATTIAIVNKGKFSKAPISIPSLAEQKIIVDKLDTLLAQVDSTKVRLEQIPQILKRFRQAVLAAAVSGKLTEEWREQNKISSDWKSVQFLELITKLRSGSGDTPSDNVCGIPILRSSAIRPQIINYEDVRYLSSEETLNEDNYLKNGDLLFTRLSGSADYVGNCALVKGLTKKYQYPDRLFCARLKDQRNANYLEYFCSSNIFREHIIKSIKSSAGHQRITLDAIRTAQIFIPDYLEQTEIVRRVEQLFAYADGIEKQVQNALERVNNLTQSILAKAFRGELTTQWRAENPDLISGENSAQALLAKIQQQRSNTKTIKRSKGNS